MKFYKLMEYVRVDNVITSRVCVASYDYDVMMYNLAKNMLNGYETVNWSGNYVEYRIVTTDTQFYDYDSEGL